VIGADGRESPDGLKTKELREGTSITLVVERKDGKPSLREIRLGTKAGFTEASEPPVQQDTSRLIPLTDLGQREYQGLQGGLYPSGANTRPAIRGRGWGQIARPGTGAGWRAPYTRSAPRCGAAAAGRLPGRPGPGLRRPTLRVGARQEYATFA
jgi:hypothetical protein